MGSVLTHVALQNCVGASTWNPALSALSLLYRTALKRDIDGSIDAVRAKKPVNGVTPMCWTTKGARQVRVLS